METGCLWARSRVVRELDRGAPDDCRNDLRRPFNSAGSTAHRRGPDGAGPPPREGKRQDPSCATSVTNTEKGLLGKQDSSAPTRDLWAPESVAVALKDDDPGPGTHLSSGRPRSQSALNLRPQVYPKTSKGRHIRTRSVQGGLGAHEQTTYPSQHHRAFRHFLLSTHHSLLPSLVSGPGKVHDEVREGPGSEVVRRDGGKLHPRDNSMSKILTPSCPSSPIVDRTPECRLLTDPRLGCVVTT